jgi:hypothetical protein
MTNSIHNQPVWPCSKEAANASAPAEGTWKRAIIQFSVAGSIALLLFFFFKRPVMASVVFGISTVILVCGLFIPPAFKAIEHFGQKLGEWVGTGLTWLLLVPFFYLCFVPARIIAAIRGKDPLNLKLSSKAKTYWVPHKPVNNIERYQKQH